ncbi:MAG: YihY/virulence factor BrkB family protein [Chloroflexi bacterium]|nr:YihY/virulence factor BrkB family protein [Chloroflexota bacterium]
MYFVRFVLFCTDTINEFLGKNCPYIAGAISFYALFSLFPLALAIISILGYVLGPNAEESKLARDIASVLPVSTEYIGDTLQGVATARAITGVASIFGLLWASTAAFGAIRKGVNAAWGIRRTRPFIKERLMDLTLVLGAGILVMFLLFVTPIFAFLNEIMEYIAPEAELAQRFLGLGGRLLTPIISFVTFIVLYRYLPNARVRFSDVWIGALAASIAFDIANWGFVWYVARFPVYNVVYGSVGAVMALLTWVYVSAIILLFGALVTSRYAANVHRAKDLQGFKLVWAGISRVRLRVVASTGVG